VESVPKHCSRAIGPFAQVDGKRCLNLASMNFLGLLCNKDIEVLNLLV
jgi:hypothetical protein